MRNCEDVDLSDKKVRFLGNGVTGLSVDGDEDSDPPKETHTCFGHFKWLRGNKKNVKCERCDYFGRCYLATVFMKDKVWDPVMLRGEDDDR